MDHVRFPLVLEMFSSSPSYNTTVIALGSGKEQRVGNWDDARIVANAALGVRSLADLQILTSFFRARKGQLRGFLYRDLFEYSVTAEPIGTGDGTNHDFQLIKSYTDAGNTDVRTILKPSGNIIQLSTTAGGTPQVATTAGARTWGARTLNFTANSSVISFSPSTPVPAIGDTVTVSSTLGNFSSATTYYVVNVISGVVIQIYDNVTLKTVSTDYTVDYTTGIIHFVTAPTAGHVISWTGEFLIPCRFAEDSLPQAELFYDVVDNKASGMQDYPEVLMLEIFEV